MRMNSVFRDVSLRRDRRLVLEGALLGLLAAFLLNALGAGDISGLRHPGTALVVAALIGAAIGLFRLLLGLVVLDALLVLATAVIAYTPVMSAPMARLVRNDKLPKDTLDAVVVLSSGLKSDTALSADGADRLIRGVELVRNGVAPQLITTTIVWRFGKRILTSDADQHHFAALAGVDRRWTPVGPVASTRDEAVKAGELLMLTRSTRIAVVTSPSHTRRACAAFERIGFKVTCVAAVEREHVTWHPFTPEDRLAAFRAWLYEKLATAEYRSFGWIR